ITGDERDPDGFVLSESIHRHSGRSVINGVFAVGEVTGETDLFGVIRQARSAAVKARAWMMRVEQGDIKEAISVAENCIRCLTCHRLCPHQAFYVSAGSARSALGVWGAACRQCGICISECPRTAVSEPGSWENGVDAFLKDLSLIRDLAPTVVYGCARSAGRAVAERPLPENTAFHGVPCAGRVSEAMIWDTLRAGAVRVLVVGCHGGNCESVHGTDMARSRVKSVAEDILEFSGFAGRVGYASCAAGESARLWGIINKFGMEPSDTGSLLSWRRS
ncbi:MAG: hydrogenase iron-sulfur subunit, partial [Pseudomonadota bacterium]